MLGAAWLGVEATAALFLPITVIAAQELNRLQWSKGSGLSPFGSAMLAAIAYGALVSVHFVSGPYILWAISAVLFILLALVVSMLRANSPEPTIRIGHLFTVIIYIAAPMACAPWMVSLDPMLFISFMLLLWTNDTGAYIVGKAIGRSKLLPKVSPGKTWEGLMGGILLTALVAWALSTYVMFGPVKEWIIVAVVVSITATVGDLLESAMKRAAGVKDSGTLMPGHGGALDRFDGYLLAAPAMLLVVHLLMAS
ncbi:MAG: phosphatidate cytidylyltransferase [Flavobacteriales bacterium]|nr:phosphatidate cytidylyltransferase [Flavobacteriales bacterium]